MAAPLAIPQAEPPPVPKRGLDTPFSGNSNGSQSREGAPSTATAPPQLRAHPFIRALPASVSFQASETGAEQHAFLTLKNVDAVRTHSVRILPPTPECFGVVSASRVVKLAPGIETKVKVTLRENGPLKKDVHGSLTVETEQGPPLAIPLHHLLPQPSFQVEPSVLSLGVVAQGTVVEKTFTISNKGGRGAEWSVKFDHSSPITVEPSSGLLGPNHREEVKVTYEAKDAGDFKSGLEFKWGEPGQVQSQGVEITASSSPQKVDFCAEDGSPLGRIDFGSLFFGSSKTVRARLKNLGPVPISYETGLYTNPDTSRGNGDHGIDTISAERLEGLQAAKSKCVTVSPASVTVSPASATVPPFSEIPVEVTLAVARDGPLKGFSTTKPAPGAAKQVFSFLTIFDVKELKRKLKLPIWGQGVEPSVTLTPIALSFGEPGVNTRSEKMLTLENGDTEVPVRFEFGRSAEFHVAPDHGTIAPRTSKTVSVTFDPKVIGPRRAVLTCDISGTDKGPVVQKLEVRVDGKAPATVAMKAATVGRVTNRSPDKKRTGFALTSVSPNSGLTTGLVSGLVEAGEDAIGGQNVHKLSRNESMMRDEHRDQYKTFLRSARMEREERENRGTANPPPPDDALNLGLSSFSGLREPEPELPLAKDPLWLIKDVNEIGKEGSYVRPKNRPLQTNTESEIHSVAKFKARPCEAGEAHECHSQLRPSDIVKIVAGPHSLDFGRVSALSTHAKIFTMTNKLHKSILVGVETRAVPELEKSEPESQVIPPGATAGFSIVLCTNKLQTVRQKVEYVINGQHRFQLEVLAEVEPVALSVSREEIDFRYSPDDWEPCITEQLTVHNPNNHTADYQWECSNPAFEVTPTRGAIEKLGSVPVTVTWRPGTGNNDGFLTLSVVGGAGASKRVRCSGESLEGKCAFKDKKLDLGMVPVGAPVHKTVPLRNIGKTDVVFRASAGDQASVLSCSPVAGRISPGGTQELELTFEAEEAKEYDAWLQVSVRGGKPTGLQVCAHAVVPTVTIEQQEFAFGAIYIGASAQQTLTLTNSSGIPAALLLDLSGHPEFRLELPAPVRARAASAAAPPEEDFADGPLQLISPGGPRSIDVEAESGDSATGEIDDEGPQYKILLAAKKTLTFVLTFLPTRDRVESFDLPLSILGVPADEQPARAVRARGLKPRARLAPPVLAFGAKIVKKETVKQIPYAMETVFTNTDEKPLTWQLGTADVDASKGVFTVEPKQGVLAEGASTTIRVTFLPREAEQYKCSVPVHLDGTTEKEPYSFLTLKGTGLAPGLAFEVREITLPVVPLGIRSCARFYLVNKGYDNLDVKYRLPIDSEKAPLQLEFPEGTLIGFAKERLPVDVSFASDQPLSFTANLDFFDDDGRKFSVPVTGTADNCLLTNHPFLTFNKDALQISVEDGKAPTLVPDAGYKIQPPELSDASVTSQSGALARWLDVTLARAPIRDVAGEFSASKGKLLIELVENLSGKGVPGKLGKLPPNKKDQAEAVRGQYEKVLTFLKQQGALLNAVKPELLLAEEDFERVLASREQGLEGSGDEVEGEGAAAAGAREAAAAWRAVQANFANVSREAWHMTLFQVLRIFVLNRVTPKSLATLPGMEGLLPPVPSAGAKRNGKDAGTDPSLVGSNFLSVPESVLLKWMTAHFRKVLPGQAYRVTNFDADLRDGTVFYALLVSHWPGLNSFSQQLTRGAKNESKVRANAKVIIEMMGVLRLPYTITEDELAFPQARELLVFSVYLYQALPQLAPRSTVEFAGRLGERLAKVVELTNPTSKPISYHVQLEGSKEFEVGKDSIRIEPRGTEKVMITCTPSISKPVEGRLMLASKREGAAAAATMVFALRARALSELPVATWQTEARLFEYTTVELEVGNPFPGDCEFAVTLIQACVKKPAAEPEVKKAVKRAPISEEPSSASVGSADGKPVPPDAIGCDKSVLRLRMKEKGRLVVHFLPFQQGQFTCTVRLEDKIFGEINHLVEAKAKPPAPTQLPKFVTEFGKNPVVKEVVIPVTNHQFENAKRLFMEKHPGAKNKRQTELLKALGEIVQGANTRPVKFTVQSSSQYVHVPHDVTLGSPNPKPPPKEPAVNGKPPPDPKPAAPTNVLLATFSPKQPGTYPARVTLTSPADVRVFDLEFCAAAPDARAAFAFSCPARASILQELPISNGSDKPLIVKANFSGGTAFMGPREVTVAPGGMAQYGLTFRPPWIGEYTSELQLSGAGVYTLTGTGEEPLSEGHVVLECPTRVRLLRRVKVPNVIGDQEVTYSFKSDLPDVTGPDVFKVRPNSVVECELAVQPRQVGTVTGSLQFTAPTGQYCWFTVEITAGPPPCEGTVTVKSVVRNPVEVLVTRLQNPRDEPATFAVNLQGLGVSGDASVTVPAGGSADYKLVYRPLFPARGMGSVHFDSETLGLLWYKLELEAEPAPDENLPELLCEVGTTVTHQVSVTNPLSKPAVLRATSSNPRNFVANPATLTLPPDGRAEVTIEYTPSVLGEVQTGVIELGSAEAGTWVFRCSGRGSPPTSMPETTVTASLKQAASVLVSFRNPFSVPVTVRVSIDPGYGDPGPFSVLLRRTHGLLVAPFSVLQIPVAFQPSLIAQLRANLRVELEPEPSHENPSANRETLIWVFPIVGVAEYSEAGPVFRCACKARGSSDGVLEARLVGMGLVTNPERFTYEVATEEGDAAAVAQSLRIEALDEVIFGPDQPLRFRVTFAPLRILSTAADLVVTKETGGRWRFELALEASEPEPDGTIHVEAPVGKTGVSTFTLPALHDREISYRAVFGPGSPLEFDVEPTRGVLKPGGRGQELRVAFTPREYAGKPLIGKLYIHTDERDWIYEVKGSRPEYKPPVAPPRINTKLSPELATKLEQAQHPPKRNYVRENLKAGIQKQASTKKP